MLGSRYAMWLGWGPEFYFFCNDAYLPTVGIKESWVLGASARKVWEEIWPAIGPRAESVVRTGEATWDEGLLLFLERSGFPEETYHTFSYSPVPDDSGGIGGMLCVVTEETERVIGARRLTFLRELAAAFSSTRTEPEVFASLQMSAAARPEDIPFSLVYLFTDKGDARLAHVHGLEAGSPLAPELIPFGTGQPVWPSDRILDRAATVIVPDLPAPSRPVALGSEAMAPREAAVVPLAQQGQERPAGFIVVGLNPFRPFDSGYRGFLDLLAGQLAAGLANARVYAEERKRAEALAELDRAKTTFFSNVSHELRTPLTLMLGPVEDIINQAGSESGRSSQELARLAHRNGLRLLKLVNTLLDFSRMEADRMEAAFEPTDLASATADLASGFRSAIEKAGLRLVVDCPPLAQTAYVDRSLWEKIVLNLLSNAFKFTLAGEIRVTLREQDGYAHLEVRDTGTGIPEEAKPRLFERFYRVQGAQGRTHEGTGIGLALVQGLAHLHGGTVSVESVFGQGSAFTVHLPLGSGHLAPEKIRSPELGHSARSNGAFTTDTARWLASDVAFRTSLEDSPLADADALPETGAKAGKVLVVDDNADMRNYLTRLLSRRFEVTVAEDGQTALLLVARHPPDLVLSDVMMPAIDGFGLLQRIRTQPELRHVPVILLSARAGEEARIEGVGAGADDYLTKPFSARELVARVGTHIALARTRREAEDKIRMSEAQIAAIIDRSPVGIYLVDSELRIQQVNPKARPVFGEIDNLIGQDITTVMQRLWPAAAAEEVASHFRHTLATGEAYVSSTFIEGRQDSGAREYYDWQLHRLTLPDGRHGVVCYFIDISDHVLAERRIREGAERLELALTGGNLGYWNWNAENDDMRLSARTADIYGLPADARLTRTQMRLALHPDDRERAARTHQAAVQSRENYDIEYRVVHPTRGLRWVVAKGRPTYAEDGRLAGTIGVVQDITERKHAEIHLRQQKDILELIVRGVPLLEILAALTRKVEEFGERQLIAAIWLSEADGERLRFVAGPHYPQELGHLRERVVVEDGTGPHLNGAHWGERLIAADIASDPRWAQQRDLALQHGIRASWSTPILSSEGKMLGVFGIYSPQPGTPTPQEIELVDVYTRTAAIAIQRSQSETALRQSEAMLAEHARELERRVAERTARLEETVAELEAFSYSVSHDMRAPLRAMQGYADALLKDYAPKLDEFGAHYLERIRKNAERLEQLVRDILAYSKVAKEEIELAPVPLDGVVRALLAHTPQLQPSAAKITIVDPLPTVLGHEAYLAQILGNLLGNAVKFVSPGTFPEVEIRTETEGPEVKVSIVDNGIGIEPLHFDRIFQIFGRVYADKQFEGTGIGLSIVKKAVHRIGGTSGLESTLGKGSCFWFKLKRA